MLDISSIRHNPQKIKKACLDKQLDDSVVDDLLAIDQLRRELKQKSDAIRSQINENANAIKQQVQSGNKPDKLLIKKGKELKEKLKQLENDEKYKDLNQYDKLLLSIPNVPANDVPIGQDETGNKVVRKSGEIRQFSFKPKSHHDLMLDLDLLDLDRAVKVGGFRSYFLKNQAVTLERAIMQYGLDYMQKHGFTLMTAPSIVKKKTLYGTGYLPWGEDDHYLIEKNEKVDDESTYLAGTAEVALTAYYQDELLRHQDLPVKLAAISPCYRREVGAHGKDTQGIIRVHQFTKVEQVVLTQADEQITRDWHEKMIGFVEEIVTNLELPYQILLMCTGDMGAGQRKKYDLEVWFPSQNKYRETHSASYFNDFQARRCNIKYQDKDGKEKFVYTLNNTVVASPRLLAAVIEYHQQKDGTIKIPKVLQKYMQAEVINKQ